MFEFVVDLYGQDGNEIEGTEKFTGTAYAKVHTVQANTMEEAVRIAVGRAQEKVPFIKQFEVHIKSVTFYAIEGDTEGVIIA